MDETASASGQAKSAGGDSLSLAEEFLKVEYELLTERAVHGEDVAHRISSFYISLLTAILGGILILIQAFSLSTRVSLISIAGACAFLLLIGVLYYDALVSQYIRNAYHHLGIQAIRAHFRRYETVALTLLDGPSLLPETRESLFRRLTTARFGFPGGNQLTMIQVTNSLKVAALICCLVWSIAGSGFRPVATLLASAVGALTSLAAHRVLADWMIRRNLEQIESALNGRRRNVDSTIS